jgi:hypothetical protein
MRKLILALVVVIVVLIAWLLLRSVPTPVPTPVPTYYETFEQMEDGRPRAKYAYNAPNPVHILGTPVTRNNMKLYVEYLLMRSYMLNYMSSETSDTELHDTLVDIALRVDMERVHLERALLLTEQETDDILTTLRSFDHGSTYRLETDMHIFATTGMAYAIEAVDTFSFNTGSLGPVGRRARLNVEGEYQRAQDIVRESIDSWVEARIYPDTIDEFLEVLK